MSKKGVNTCNVLERNGVLMTPKTVRLPIMHSTVASSILRSNRQAVKDVKNRPTIAANIVGKIVGPYVEMIIIRFIMCCWRAGLTNREACRSDLARLDVAGSPS